MTHFGLLFILGCSCISTKTMALPIGGLIIHPSLSDEVYFNPIINEHRNNDVFRDTTNKISTQEQCKICNKGINMHPILVRNKRQSSRNLAMNLANDHTRNVGRIHGQANLNAYGRNFRNYHYNSNAGLGSVIWRSRNSRHSLGVGAAAGISGGRFNGNRYSTRPNWGVGASYQFRF